jgi:hypothetical protein
VVKKVKRYLADEKIISTCKNTQRTEPMMPVILSRPISRRRRRRRQEPNSNSIVMVLLFLPVIVVGLGIFVNGFVVVFVFSALTVVVDGVWAAAVAGQSTIHCHHHHQYFLIAGSDY